MPGTQTCTTAHSFGGRGHLDMMSSWMDMCLLQDDVCAYGSMLLSPLVRGASFHSECGNCRGMRTTEKCPLCGTPLPGRWNVPEQGGDRK